MDIKGAEIFAAGTWNGNVYTVEDIDAIVASFKAMGLKGKVPLKLGHDNEVKMKDGAPALGWVERVWRDGKMLMADFGGIPKVLHDAIKDKMYRTVSIEILRDVQADTRVIPWVLDAVSLLGATQPAVGILKDLQALTLARRPALQGGVRLVFKREFSATKEVKQMDEKEVKALVDDALAKQSEKFTKQIDAVQAKADEQVKTAQAESLKLQLSAHRSVINGKFEVAIKAETLEPKFREQFKKFSGLEDDARTLAIKLEDVDAFIKDNSKEVSKKFSSAKTEGGEGADADEVNMTEASEVVSHRVKKIMLTRKVDVSDIDKRIAITQEVLKADKALGEAYRDNGLAPAADAA